MNSTQMKYPTSSKIVNPVELSRLLLTWRLKNCQIVFTNGCFDILHLGHVDYLEKARALGDRLVLGLNTDASVRRQNKGTERPLQNEEARCRLIASLQFVDAVCLFDEETPIELINLVRPDILVKGDDYSVETIVGAKEVLAWGGNVKTIPLVQGHSTTNIVNKIKNSLNG